MTRHDHRRLHSTQGYLGPMQYGLRWCEAQRKKGRVNRGLGTPQNRSNIKKPTPAGLAFSSVHGGMAAWRHGGTMERVMGITQGSQPID